MRGKPCLHGPAATPVSPLGRAFSRRRFLQDGLQRLLRPLGALSRFRRGVRLSWLGAFA